MVGTGFIGARSAPLQRQTSWAFLLLWAVCGGLACVLTGGLPGPFAVFCLLPSIAGLAAGSDWKAGLIFSVVALLLVGTATALGRTEAVVSEDLRLWLTGGAIAATGLGVGAALYLRQRRIGAEAPQLDDQAAAFQALMGDLPDLAVALTATGALEALYGRADPLFPVDRLIEGLPASAAPSDRATVEQALAKALETGEAQARFAPALNPDEPYDLIVRRTAKGGLAALISPKSRQAGCQRPSPVGAEAAIIAQLRAAERGRVEAEEGRRKAEALAFGRMQFLANMSHELRTPLNAIMGFSDMMRARMFGELKDKYGEYAELIHESGAHLLSLINDILDLSKIEAQKYPLKREFFDVRDPLNDALRLMRLQADESGVKLRALLPSAPLLVDADKRALKQIALNLLSNAVKFTPRGGSVFITAEARGPELEIVVADTGVGISAEDLERLAQPYQQAGAVDLQLRGTGLGLSLVSALAGLHGGALHLESRLGEGTAATVRLPVVLGASAGGSNESPLPPEGAGAKSPPAPGPRGRPEASA